MSIGQELLNVPMGEMIRQMAFAIAEAQMRLDNASVETAEMMGGLKTIYDANGNITFEDSRVFFGAEYMTISQALVSQLTGQDDAALLAAIGSKFSIPPTTTAAEGLGGYTISFGTNDKIAVSETKVNGKGYQTCLQALQIVKDDPLTTDINKTNLGKAIVAIQKENNALLQTEIRVPTRVSLLELGFAPVFYSFVDTIIEVKIAISITQESSSVVSTQDTNRSINTSRSFIGVPFLGSKKQKSRTVSTSQVNATYSSRYSYSAEGSSLLRTKLVPLPTPPLLEERIRALMDAERERRQRLLGTTPTPA